MAPLDDVGQASPCTKARWAALYSLSGFVLAAGLLVVLGQDLKLFDLPFVRDLPNVLPFSQGAPGTVASAPSPLPPTVAVNPSASPSPVPVQSDVCSAAAPKFVLAMARLKARLGADMGTPTECERVVDASGDTEQTTTTGLAYYRANINAAAFTNGVDHWALTSDGLAHWTSEDLGHPLAPRSSPNRRAAGLPMGGAGRERGAGCLRAGALRRRPSPPPSHRARAHRAAQSATGPLS